MPNPNDIYLPGGLAQAAEQARQAGNSTGADWLPQTPRDRSRIVRDWENDVHNPSRGQNAVEGLAGGYPDDTALREAKAWLGNDRERMKMHATHQPAVGFDEADQSSVMDSPWQSVKHTAQNINPDKIEGLAMAGSMMPVPQIAAPSMAVLGGFGLNRILHGESGAGGAMDAAGVMMGASELAKLGKLGAEAAQGGRFGAKLASAREMASDPSYSGISRKAIGEMAGIAGAGRSKQAGQALSQLGQSFDAANSGNMAEHRRVWNGRWADDARSADPNFNGGVGDPMNAGTAGYPHTAGGPLDSSGRDLGGTSHENYTTQQNGPGPIHWGPDGVAPEELIAGGSTHDNGNMTAQAIRALKEEAGNKYYKGKPGGGGGGGSAPPPTGGGNGGPTRDATDYRRSEFGGARFSKGGKADQMLQLNERVPRSADEVTVAQVKPPANANSREKQLDKEKAKALKLAFDSLAKLKS